MHVAKHGDSVFALGGSVATMLNDFRFAVTRETTSRHPPANTPNMRHFGVQNVYQTPNKAIESRRMSSCSPAARRRDGRCWLRRDRFCERLALLLES